ncbi:MAG TPA: 16S rRNA (adenine(1518)-N(6)/adenine(1519)-N(6))-dimethyltransferase [Thiomicrospira sp.]|jgi:16S rRNA (adenine1518-N6/adenine1519-N6)-dimethyltransferase|nr:16S rRNA (adenine(1518)-N(6)/adenine(1519)-N(6))-dimethyltransferase [Thiomicrospira sp.]
MSSHKHKKRFGQNFLNNSKIIEQIIAGISPKSDQHLVEIGPGEAALTEPLLSIVKKLDIIEIDNDLIAPLERKFGNMPAFNLHHTDALTFDYATLLTAGEERFRVVGNLPYNISSPLMFHLLTFADKIQDMHFMLQKEVVERITSVTGKKSYGRLSVMMQYACETEYLFTVGPENFNPPPKVDSAIIRLTPHRTLPFKADCETTFAKLVKQSFSLKRKNLRNNLKGLLNTEQIEACGIDPDIRAERLNVEKFVILANFLHRLKQ